jgi:putative ABC transport system permease protein
VTAAALRLAFRLARRDARKSKRRSTLVIVLLGLPVFAIVGTSTTLDSFAPTPAEQAVRDMGHADAIVDWDYRGPVAQDPTDRSVGAVPSGTGDTDLDPHDASQILDALPGGSRLVEITTGHSVVAADGGRSHVDVRGIDLSDKATEGILTVLDGSVPGPGQVALSRTAADRLGVDVGDRLKFSSPTASTRTVTAVVEAPGDLDAEFVAMSPKSFHGKHSRWLAVTPKPVTWDDVRRYNDKGMAVYSRAVADDPPPTPPQVPTPVASRQQTLILLAFLIAMIGLEVVLLAGPAFAIGAKRRGREFALLGANGATPAQVRRTVLAGGLTLGAVSSLVSGVLAVGLAWTASPIVESVMGERLAGYRFWPQLNVPVMVVAVITGGLAAVVPAFIASRQPVATALAGRAGITRSPKRWVVLGVALIVGGVACALVGNGSGGLAVLLGGIVAAELGLVLCTPGLLGLLSRGGRFLPLTARIALRDAGRNRSAAAPAISAIMAVVAASIAVSMFLMADQSRLVDSNEAVAPVGSAYADIQVSYSDPTHPEGTEHTREVLSDTADKVSAAMRRHLPVSHLYRLPALTCGHSGSSASCRVAVLPPKDKACPFDDRKNISAMPAAEQAKAAANPHCKQHQGSGTGNLAYGVFVVDSTTLAAITGATGADLAAARATLRDGGVVVNDADLLRDGHATIEIRDHPADLNGGSFSVRDSARLPAHALTTGTRNHKQILVSAEAAKRLRLAPSDSMVLFATTTHPPTEGQAESFDSDLSDRGLNAETQGKTSNGTAGVVAEVVRRPEPPALVTAAVWLLAAVSAALALAATAVACALSAAESRRDLSTLAAVGASPAIRRKLILSQAGVMSLVGAMLGVIAGAVACYVVLSTLNQQIAVVYPRQHLYTLAPPWSSIGIALVVVPLVAMLGAGLIAKSRLPSERR